MQARTSARIAEAARAAPRRGANHMRAKQPLAACARQGYLVLDADRRV
jgi:hypothetical protein